MRDATSSGIIDSFELELLFKMKMEEQSTSPKDDALSQTQDPLERRRLQNRLSQRNHRRKIRERIAKLQERVIANELRAAAALNGWDQAYNPSLFPRAHSVSEYDNSTTSRDISPSIPDQPFMPSYPLLTFQAWPNDSSISPQPPVYPDLPGVSDANPISPTPTVTASSSNGFSPAPGLGEESYREMTGSSEFLPPNPLSTSAPNQPLYYVATEAALPQIIQVINTMSPQYKVIVLVPPESQTLISMNTLSSPAFPYGSYTGLESSSIPQPHSQNLGCLCYPHNAQSGSLTQSALRPWVGAGQYAQMCPLHKIASSGTALGGFPVRMV